MIDPIRKIELKNAAKKMAKEIVILIIIAIIFSLVYIFLQEVLYGTVIIGG